MRVTIRQYMISPVLPQVETHGGMTNAEHRAAIRAADQKNLAAMRDPITAIVARNNGTVVHNGEGYGVEGHDAQFKRYMIVQVPETALDELKAVPGVRVERFENTTFNLPQIRSPGPR